LLALGLKEKHKTITQSRKGKKNAKIKTSGLKNLASLRTKDCSPKELKEKHKTVTQNRKGKKNAKI